jgi:hypothetical protein
MRLILTTKSDWNLPKHCQVSRKKQLIRLAQRHLSELNLVNEVLLQVMQSPQHHMPEGRAKNVQSEGSGKGTRGWARGNQGNLLVFNHMYLSH